MVLFPSPVRLAVAGTLILGAAVPLCASGCGKKGLKLHSVSGKVLYEGNAPEGATVVFQPVDSQTGPLMPSGIVRGDGSFQLTTHPHGQGAPEGEYIVLITWYPPDARESEDAKNQLPDRYGDPTQPQLRATIKAGKNQLEPFVLTK